MHADRCFRRMRYVVFLGCLIVGGCSTIDESLAPRGYTVDEGWDTYRNNGILLNLARASEGAPLQFVALNSYTGNGTIGASAGADLTATSNGRTNSLGSQSNLDGTGFSTKTVGRSVLNLVGQAGPFGVSGSTNNSIALATLETSEFYGSMIAIVDAGEFHRFLHLGIPRELIFHLFIDSIRVGGPYGVTYEFRNDPFDNEASGECSVSALRVPFGNRIWEDTTKCRYDKFKRLIQLAVEFGVSTESIVVKNEDATAENKLPAKKMQWQLCYDAAIAIDNGHPPASPGALLCGGKNPIHFATVMVSFRDTRTGGTVVAGAFEPRLRSPFGVFRYLGRLIASGKWQEVYLSKSDGGDRQLFTLSNGDGGCFAEAKYLGARYCVPAAGARNTKAIFSVLATMIALRIQRKDLPQPSTLLLQP